SPGSTRPDNGPVRRAKALARYRRSRFRRSARASADAAVQRTTISSAVLRPRETGRSLRLRADLVARTIPLLPPIALMAEAGSTRLFLTREHRLDRRVRSEFHKRRMERGVWNAGLAAR